MNQAGSLRRIGQTDIFVSPIALGCWPITGITSVDVNREDSLLTVRAALDTGINFFDTAHMYGYEGESERLIAAAIGDRRDEFVIATKSGLHWDAGRQRVCDGRPETIHRECRESLRRLETDYLDLLFLHAPDRAVPLAETAGAFYELHQQGLVRAVGMSNVTISQIEEFRAICPVEVCQPAYNMLQREIDQNLLPWCRQQQISVVVYWPLMKGLLAGRLRRDHIFSRKDGRQKYPMFQGQEWGKNQDFVDQLRVISGKLGKTVAQLVLNWTIHQPGITAALCGSKRAFQVKENADAMGWKLTQEIELEISDAIRARGPISSRWAI